MICCCMIDGGGGGRTAARQCCVHRGEYTGGCETSSSLFQSRILPSECLSTTLTTLSLSSSLTDHSLLTSKPEITGTCLDFSSLIFSALEGTLSCSYSITITSFDTVSDLCGCQAGCWKSAVKFNGIFWVQTAGVTELGAGTGAGFDLPTMFESWVIESIALSAILMISSFWELFHVLNKGEQWFMGFHSACNVLWDLLGSSCTGKNDWWKEWKNLRWVKLIQDIKNVKNNMQNT